MSSFCSLCCPHSTCKPLALLLLYQAVSTHSAGVVEAGPAILGLYYWPQAGTDVHTDSSPAG